MEVEQLSLPEARGSGSLERPFPLETVGAPITTVNAC